MQLNDLQVKPPVTLKCNIPKDVSTADKKYRVHPREIITSYLE